MIFKSNVFPELQIGSKIKFHGGFYETNDDSEIASIKAIANKKEGIVIHNNNLEDSKPKDAPEGDKDLTSGEMEGNTGDLNLDDFLPGLSKDELEEYALAKFGINIDKRKSHSRLVEEIKLLETDD